MTPRSTHSPTLDPAAYYSFYLPVALAMLMAGVKDEKAFAQAQDVLVPLGRFFQIQDDYLDCFGDPATIGMRVVAL